MFTPHTPEDIREMLQAIGAKSVEELFQSIPPALRLKTLLKLPAPLSELETGRHLNRLAGKNISADQYISFLGAGCYNHYIPAAVNHLAGRSEFYTSYTPYQPEASQGNLTAFFEYQTMMCELTGLDVTNASMYDGATALAEAIIMSLSVTGKKKVLLAKTIHPEYRQVVTTYLADLNAEIGELPYAANGQIDLAALKNALTDQTACVAIQTPNFFGVIEDGSSIAGLVHGAKALLITVVNPTSLAVLKPPAEYDADIAVGEAQPLGNEMYLGGPHLGFFAAKMAYVRKMPGRLVGQAFDKEGKRGFVLTLSTREQHIRREKATSNICSNEALIALRATIYLSLLGKQGFQTVANLCLQNAHYLAQKIAKIKGCQLVFNSPFFHEFAVRMPVKVGALNKQLLKNGIIGGLDLSRFYPELKNTVLFCATEVNTKDEMDRLVDALAKTK